VHLERSAVRPHRAAGAAGLHDVVPGGDNDSVVTCDSMCSTSVKKKVNTPSWPSSVAAPRDLGVGRKDLAG
jgi:hypothetical protein